MSYVWVTVLNDFHEGGGGNLSALSASDGWKITDISRAPGIGSDFLVAGPSWSDTVWVYRNYATTGPRGGEVEFLVPFGDERRLACFGFRDYASLGVTNFGRIREGLPARFVPHQDSGVTETGAWFTSGDSDRNKSGGSRRSNVAGATISAEVTGSTVGIITSRITNGGFGTVSIDGDFTRANLLPAVGDAEIAEGWFTEAQRGHRYLDCYLFGVVWAWHLPLADGLEDTTHTVTLRVQGTANAASADQRVYVDGFVGAGATDLPGENGGFVFYTRDVTQLQNSSGYSALTYIPTFDPEGADAPEFLGENHGHENQISAAWRVDGQAISLGPDEYASGTVATFDRVTEMNHPSVSSGKVADKEIRYTARTGQPLQMEADVRVTWRHPGKLTESYWGNVHSNNTTDGVAFDRVLIGDSQYLELEEDSGGQFGRLPATPLALFGYDHPTVALAAVPSADRTLRGWINSDPLNAFLADSSNQHKAYHARSTSGSPEYVAAGTLHVGTVGWKVVRDDTLNREPVTARQYLSLLGDNPSLINVTDFTSGWAVTRVTLTTGQNDPLGGTTAALIAVNSGEPNGLIMNATIPKAEEPRSYLASLWARPAGRDWVWIRLADTNGAKRTDAYFDLVNGTVGTVGGTAFEPLSVQIIERAGGWYQCLIAATTDANTGIRMQIYPAEKDLDPNFSDSDGDLGVLVWNPAIYDLSGGAEDNPNDLPLVYADPLADAGTANFFETDGFVYENGYARASLNSGGVDGGSLKLAVGKTPSSYLAGVGDPDVRYTDLEWAIDVRYTGAGAPSVRKIARSAGLQTSNWIESFVSHVWDPDANGYPNIDPVSAIDNTDSMVGSSYNDTSAWNSITGSPHFSGWLGASRAAGVDILDGEWHRLRVRQKLNTPGQTDGLLWCSIDGQVLVDRTDVNWRKGWDGDYGWNVVFIEHYINSPGASGTVHMDIRNLEVRGTGDAGPVPPAVLEVTTESLAGVVEGTSYNQTVTASGGSAPYTWSITAGALPTGLSLNSSSGAITGTVSADPGTYNFTVRVTDSESDTDSKALSIVVTAAPSGDGPDFFVDWSDYANPAAVYAEFGGGTEYSPEDAYGKISLETVTGQSFSKALRSTFNTPPKTDQQKSLTLDMGPKWATAEAPKEIWGHFKMRHSEDFTYDGPLSQGGGPGGKVFFMFDDQRTGLQRWEFYLGLSGSEDQQTIFAGNTGSGGDHEVPHPESNFCDGEWKDFWFHANITSSNAVWETYFNGVRTALGTGVNTQQSPSRYFRYLTFFPNVNTGAANDGQFREAGPVSIWTSEPDNWLQTEEPAGVEPFHTFDFDNYANKSAMLADPLVSDSSNSGGQVALVQPGGATPWGGSKAFRATYLGGVGNETQAGLTFTIPDASTRALREIWIEFYARFSPGWTTVGPYSGNPDHKFAFLFDQNPSGSWRWENMIGVFGTDIQVMVGGGTVGFGSAGIGDIWDGQWHRMRYHAKMDSSGGLYQLTIDERSPIGFTGQNTNRGSQYYFNSLAVFRNLNKGSSTDQWCEAADIKLYDTDPGWGI